MDIIEGIFIFIVRVLGFIGAIWFFYTVYFSKGYRPNIPDEDLDRVSKGGDPH